MNRSRILGIASLLVLLFACHDLAWRGARLVQQCTAAEPSFQELLSRLLPGMGAEKIADRQDPQQQFQAACYALGAPGREAERAGACKLIAARLGPQTAKPARIWLLKQLAVIGQGECVAAIAAQLDDKDAEIADAARRALENDPAPEANAALLKALEASARAGATAGSSSSARHVAIINSLGERRDPASVPALAKLLDVKEEGVATAAANAMFKLHREGMAAIKMLAVEDAKMQAIGAGYVGEIKEPGAAVFFTCTLRNLPPSGQVLLLAALAARGDKAAMPAAVAAAKSENQQVRSAAIESLARLGDASVVPLLIEAVAAGGEAGAAARESLQQVWGHGVDEAIVAAMKKAEPPLRDSLLDVLEQRGAAAAAPALLEFVEGKDAKLRDRAMRALGKLAGPENVPAMIQTLLGIEKGATRDDAEKAIMLACSRVAEEDNRADAVLAALAGATDAQRIVLLPLLGRIGGKTALAAVETAMKSPSAELREAGIRALCNWPDASVADELLGLAQNAESAAHRNWALRGYIRVIGLQSRRSGKQSLAMFKKAMEMITRDEERKLLLSRVSEVRDVAALRFAVPYLDNPALAAEASRAVVNLARRRELMEPHRVEFTAALKKVSEVCKDQRVVEQAQRIMAGL